MELLYHCGERKRLVVDAWVSNLSKQPAEKVVVVNTAPVARAQESEELALTATMRVRYSVQCLHS